MTMIHRVEHEGGVIESFESYGGGVAAPDGDDNPLRYVITWNPRNVVMSGESGAQFLSQGKIKIVPWHHVFDRTWMIDIEGVGPMEGYPNRDSISYRETFGLKDVKTLIRGTLRYPGWSETWQQIVHLGLPNEHLRIPNLKNRTWKEIVEMFLPRDTDAQAPMEQRVANYLGINPTGAIIRNLSWLGLFSDEPTGCNGETISDALVELLKHKLQLAPDSRDLVVLYHRIHARYPKEGDRTEIITSTFTLEGRTGRLHRHGPNRGTTCGGCRQTPPRRRIPLNRLPHPNPPRDLQTDPEGTGTRRTGVQGECAGRTGGERGGVSWDRKGEPSPCS